MSELLMDYVNELEAILAGIATKDYTIAKNKCQELLDEALEQRSDYEDYLGEEAPAYDNMKLERIGLPF